MRAITLHNPGAESRLVLTEVPTPLPERNEVRVRIRAAGVNRADLLQRRGLHPAPSDAPSNILGLEFAGEVDEIGKNVVQFKQGDRVFGLVGGGAYAEQICTHERMVTKLPDCLSFEEGGAIPEAFITAYDAIVSQASLASGETLLVHAIGSGVGTAALQIGKAIGAFVIGTSRTSDKLEKARQLGLDLGIEVKDGRFADTCLQYAQRGVDAVLELVGGDYLVEDLRCMGIGGRIAIVGLVGGGEAHIGMRALLQKRITLFGTSLRSRPFEEKIALMQLFSRSIVPLLQNRTLRAVVDRIFSMEQAEEAHRCMASGELFGKVVLRMDGKS